MVGGTVNVTPSGGTAPYTYAWVRSSGSRSTISNATSSNPSINATLVANDNFTESWTVTVKDSTQVSTTASVTVNFKVTVPTLTASINPNPLNITAATPGGLMGGTVNVNTSGGIAPYTYAWVRNSGTVSNISNATSSGPTISATLNTAGQSLTESWTVTVKDSTNTSTSASVTANFTVNSTPLSANISPATVNLNTTEAGTVSSTVTATPSGGVAPYRYQWNRTTGTRSIISSSTVSAPSISATLVTNDNFSETWNVVITDANNVTSSANVIVNFKVTAPGVAVVRYIHTDGLGSPVAKSDASGNLIAGSRTRYEPYGMSVAGTAVPTIGFTGHVNDADTGLTYMQQRYYDPVAGRFLSEDPVLTDANTGTSFNRYVFANNNPYKFVDPDGRSALDIGFLAVDTFKLGVAVYTGVGVGPALVDFGLSVAGVASPIPGTGQFLKGVVAAEHAVQALKGAEKVAEVAVIAKNGETAATKLGKLAHKEWDAGKGFEKEVRLPSGKRADAVNFAENHVKELKPDNARAIKSGEKQVEGYRKELETEHGGKWTSSVETYSK